MSFKMEESYAKSYGDVIGWRVTDEVWIVNVLRRSRTTARHINKLKRILAEKNTRFIEIKTCMSCQINEFRNDILNHIHPLYVDNYKSLMELVELGIVDLNIVWAKFLQAYLVCLKMGNEQERKKVQRTIKKLNLDSYKLAELELIKVLTEKRKEEGPCVI